MSCNCIRESGLSISNCLKWVDKCPPSQPTWRGVWEKEKLLARAAGVAESSGRIQVSVKPKMLSVDSKEKAEIKSALLTADWQFQRPMEKKKRCSRRCRDRAQVSRITLASACDVRAWLRDNRNGLKTHDRGGRIEDSKGEHVREDRNDT